MTGRKKLVFLGVLCVIAAVCAFYGARYLLRRQTPDITLYDGHTDSLHLKNAVACYIIENGYGYRARPVMQTAYVMQTSMQKNLIEINLEIRRQECSKWFNDQVRAGRIVSLGATLEGSSLFFVIPQWVAEQYGIETVLDMRNHWQVFKDPDSPSKGVFYNAPIGSGCDRINTVKLEAYGLRSQYNIVSPPSAPALEAILARHQERHQPVFGFCWAPNAVMGAHKWHILKEPAYSDDCWTGVMEAVEHESAVPVERACAYKTAATEKIVARSLLTKAPDLVEMLKKMKIEQQTMNEIFAWMRRYNVKNWNVPALHFLREYESEWRAWVTPSAFGRVRIALVRAPGAAVHRQQTKTPVPQDGESVPKE